MMPVAKNDPTGRGLASNLTRVRVPAGSEATSFPKLLSFNHPFGHVHEKKKKTHTHTQLCETENLLNTHVFSPCTCLAYRYTVSSEANSEQRLKKWLDRCGLTATWRVTAINSVHTASDSSCYFVYCEAQNVVLYCSLDWSSSAITLSSPITWRWERLFLQSPFDRAARPGRPQNLRA